MSAADRVVRVYESTAPSGNAYKVLLLLAHLGRRAEVVALDLLADPPETRRPEFLAKNPNGRIPILELDDGTYLAESGAILYYLALGTPWFPADPLAQARVLEWMFFEQYSHEPYVAVLKYWTLWGGLHNKTEAEIALLVTRGQAALGVMDQHLSRAPFFGGDRYTIADIALFAYTQAAGEVGYDMARVPAVTAWLDRVRAQPGFVPMRREIPPGATRPAWW